MSKDKRQIDNLEPFPKSFPIYFKLISELGMGQLQNAQAYSNPAGTDLFATDDAYLGPGERRIFPTGVAMAIPRGYYGRIADKSGVASKLGLTVLGGVIDSDYRG